MDCSGHTTLYNLFKVYVTLYNLFSVYVTLYNLFRVYICFNTTGAHNARFLVTSVTYN